MSHFVAEDFKQLLMRRRAQDAPHSLGGALAEQFSWSASILCFPSGRSKDVFYRNYDHVAGLWQLEQWLPESVVTEARTHYAAYSVQRADGLRVISLNTDLCKCHCVARVKPSSHNVYDPGYRYGVVLCLDVVIMTIFHSANWFNFMNLSLADNSGMLRFLTDELQDAEDNGDRGMSLADFILYFY
jgi:hypothetical protein